MKGLGLAGAMLVWASGAAWAQDDPAAESRAFDAVNGATISCPPPPIRTPEQMAAQFETRPRNLDELSRGAQEFFNSDSEIGRQFRERQARQFAEDWAFLCRYRDANAELVASGLPTVCL